MSRTDYLTLLTEAHDFTVRNLYEEASSYDTDLHLKKYDDASIRKACTLMQDIFSELAPSDVVNKCLPICLTINDLLNRNHFQSILTTGYTLINHKEKEYYTDRYELVRLFTNLTGPMTTDFHVWLTVGNYIIDPIYMVSAYFHQLHSYPQSSQAIIRKYEELPLRFGECTVDYIPQITGTRLYNRLLPPHLRGKY